MQRGKQTKKFIAALEAAPTGIGKEDDVLSFALTLPLPGFYNDFVPANGEHKKGKNGKMYYGGGETV